MPYSERLAEAYIQAASKKREQGANGEDPLFTAMAGDNNMFVGGIPKQTWDSMSPEEREKWNSLPPSYQKGVRAAGAALGATAGTVAGAAMGGAVEGPVGALIGGAAGGGAGGAIGYDIADDVVKDKTPPPPVSREELRRQFEAAKRVD